MTNSEKPLLTSKASDDLTIVTNWQQLLSLIDKVWNAATESEEVPHHEWASRIINDWMPEQPTSNETCEQRAPVERALARRVYLKSERDMSGYRVVIGFDTLTDVQAAHQEVADIPKAPTQKASESRVAYNSNGDAYLAEPPPSSE